jgi:hypoxanthine-DNA glycosylase
MEIKTVNRNIPADRENCNDKFRVKYNDRKTFHLLIVNITRNQTGETQTFSFKAVTLPDKDSIHFSTAIINNKLVVYWSGASPEKEEKSKSSINPIQKVGTIEKVRPSLTNKKPVMISKVKSGFDPIVFPDSTILILGTMPGEQSLAKQEYYAHPRNLIWKIIATLINEPIPFNYSDKKALLQKAHIALWDVCDVCSREGSSDIGITDEVPNDLLNFLNNHKKIKTIAFNGGKSENLYEKYFKHEPQFQYLSLPSTSPANGAISWENKLETWSKIFL